MKTVAEFWDNVGKGTIDECWPWNRARVEKGYGVVYLRKKRWYTHQLSYTVSIGEIPEGMCVCHACDNPPCCNPSHLFLGTNYDNTMDKVSKGRCSRTNGIRNGANKLTEQQVLDIRSEHATGKIGYAALGRRYQVHEQTIKEIVIRKTWAWLNPTSFPM